MTKKLLLTFALLLTAVTGAFAAYSGSCGDVSYSYVESTNTLTISGTGAMADYEDPSNRPWNSYAGNIKTVVIGAGVTTIGKNAFNFSGLTSITIPASVTSIGKSAFNECSGLTSITIPANVTTIGDYAFASTGLTSIEIPASVTSIGEYAFTSCSGLTTVSFAAGSQLTTIGNYVFNSCSDLTSITIPARVTSIGNGVFAGCSNLATMTVEAGNTVYDSRNVCNAIIEKSTNTLIAGCKGTTIPTTVTSIGNAAFQFCNGLTSITIPATVTTIGGFAFEGCVGLTSITIPASVTTIGESAFEGCFNLATVTVYAPSCTLEENALLGCYNLANIYVFSDLVSQYQTYWSAYAGIIKKMPKPSGKCGENVRWVLTGESPNYTLTITGTGAMADYEDPSDQPWIEDRSSIKTVVITSGVTSIGEGAFSSCEGLKSITIPASVTSISKYAFGGCSKLETMTVEDGNAVYDSRNGCNAIIEKLTNTLIIGCKNSTIPFGVTTIGDGAFSVCKGLKSITIPASVTTIGEDAFEGCLDLATVTVYAPSCTLGIDAFENCPALTIYVFRDLVDDYKDADNWSNYKDRITEMLTPNGNCGENVRWVLTGESPNYTLTISGTGAIQDAVWGSMPWNSYKSSITTLIIEDGVTSISEQAFVGCSSLTSVTIPASVETIGMYAFYGCNSLTSIEIPSGVTTIGKFAFYDCIGLTTIEIPASVTSIGINPFYGCSGLESISVASGNTKYDSRNKCNAIIEKETNKLIVGCKNSVIPDDVTAIGESAFNGCTGLTSIEIPASVTTIGEWVFENCTSLKSIEIPASVTSIGINAFYGCSGLESISVAEGNPTYDSRNNCNALIETKKNTLIVGCKNSVIPDDVTSIGNYAFKGCTGLTTIEIPAGVTTIGTQAFSGCTDLTSIVIPASVTTIGGYAFWACTGSESISVASGNAKYHSGGNCLIETESHTLILGCKNSVIPDDVTTIGDFAFYDCIGLTTIEIPASVTTIGDYALQNCTSLTSIEIPASVTSIGDFAFDGCTSLESIEIPASVTSIGGGAFEDCTGLNSVTIYAPELSEYGYGYGAFYNNADGRKIYVFKNCMDYYKAQAWSVDYPGMGFYEEDILPITDISLKDNDDNSTLIAAASGNAIAPLNVTLKGRTLYKDGDWNTLCLPFSVTVGNGVMADATAMTLNGSESGFDASTGVLTLNFVGVTSGNTIAAGTPFIVKWQKPDGYVAYNPATPEAECSDIVSPVFEGITVSNAATTQTFGNGSFKGTYASITYEEENKSILFVGGENSLYWPTAGSSIGAQRAYFELNDGQQARNIVLNLGGENATGIHSTTNFTNCTNLAGAYYTLDGRKLAGKPSAPGIYVKDGHKVAIK